MKDELEIKLDRKIKSSKCVPGINYISVDIDDENTLLYEIYLKDKNEYKIVGMWNTRKKIDRLPEYCKNIYKELLKQGLNKAGSEFIALDVKNEEDSKNFMNYLISIRKKHVSYTELWKEKNKILKNHSLFN